MLLRFNHEFGHPLITRFHRLANSIFSSCSLLQCFTRYKFEEGSSAHSRLPRPWVSTVCLPHSPSCLLEPCLCESAPGTVPAPHPVYLHVMVQHTQQTGPGAALPSPPQRRSFLTGQPHYRGASLHNCPSARTHMPRLDGCSAGAHLKKFPCCGSCLYPAHLAHLAPISKSAITF